MNVFNTKIPGMNNPQDLNMIWMPTTTSIEGFFPTQGVPISALDELTQHSALMDPTIPNDLMANTASHQMTGLPMNAVELFQFQQQQAAQLQLQHQMELQNFSAAIASQAAAAAAVQAAAAVASNNHVKEETMGASEELDENDEDDDDELDENEMDQQHHHHHQYLPNPYAFTTQQDPTAGSGGGVGGGDNSDQENALLAGDYSSNSNSSFLLGQQQHIFNALNVKSSTSSTQTSATKESFKKIKPVKRPGLVLKTPIAYQGDIDPSVIPIQRDGMAVCEKCGAIGVKHSFYTRQRRFCSMACARGFELTSIQSVLQQTVSAKDGNNKQQQQNNMQQHAVQNSSYRFKFANGGDNNDEDDVGTGGDGVYHDETTTTNNVESNNRLIMPQEEMPKLSRLPSPCPQDDRIQTIRRRPNELGNSYDWTEQLGDVEFFAAPVTCFRHAPGYDMWPNIVTDMKVEVENTDSDQTIVMGNVPHSFWVATVLKIQGYKALLRYEGFGDDPTHDFWVNLCSSEVHPVGWCATRGKPLIPPRSIENKYNDWKEFLVQHLSGARTLPSTFYNKISDSFRSRFRIGLLLEVVDKNRISQMKVATVCKIVGKRLFVQYFDGPAEDGFWCHEDSSLIHHVGWSASVGHNLAAPDEYHERVTEELFQPHSNDSTVELFKMNFSFEDYYLNGRVTGFVKGMKLEAIDPLNLSSICVATVMDVLNFGYIMIRIDSYDPDATGADWFCYHEKSPSIFPAGFCSKNNINLTPPKGYDSQSFTWEQYLIDTQSIAASEDLFPLEKTRHRFKIGMKLECADLMDPRLVCVATIARVVGRLLKIHFDGWEDEYDQWLDSNSPDVYPVGWCYLVGHKLEGPRILPKLPQPSKISPKMGRRKRGRKKGSLNRSTEKTAPFTRTAQIKKEQEEFEQQKQKTKLQVKKERVSTVRVKQEPMKIEPEPIESEPPPILQAHDGAGAGADEEQEEEDDDDYESSMNQSFDTSNTSLMGHMQDELMDDMDESNATASTEQVQDIHQQQQPQLPPQQQLQEKYIPKLSRSSTSSSPDASSSSSNAILDPNSWTTDDVVQFLTINDCTVHCNSFVKANVDGKRMLDLTKDDIITLLGMKVGPALKIFDLIQQLRLRVPKLKGSISSKRFL